MIVVYSKMPESQNHNFEQKKKKCYWRILLMWFKALEQTELKKYSVVYIHMLHKGN